MSDQPSLEQRANLEREKSAEQVADRIGIQTQQKEVSKRQFNPNFLEKLQDADIDTDKHPWLEGELGPDASGAHILGNRNRQHEERQLWLNENKAERAIAERSPGRLLRRHDMLHALWQGMDSADDPEYHAPIHRQDERRDMRAAYDVATTMQSLAVGGKGIDAVTTATTENRTVNQRDDESQTVREKIAGMM